jgi:hypothetical protein
MSLHKLRLELSRDHKFPEGSNRRGYELVAPLDANGYLDASLWHKHRERCRVRRFCSDENEEPGHLVRKPGGSWAFHYDIHGGNADDESGYRLSSHNFLPGEYVSIRAHDGV